MTRKPIVQLRHLTKRVGRKMIVDDISLEVAAGEVFGLLGTPGSGRMTLVGMMTGMVASTSGQVVINGHDIKSERNQAIQEIGAVIEFPDLYPFLTGRDNLLHFARLSPQVTSERIEEVVKRVGAVAYVHQKVKTYSNAQRQRIALAQALLHQPSLLLIEPIGPDLDILHEYVDLLRELADEEGVAVIITSPLLSVMERVCDRVGIIHEGRLVNIREFRHPQQDQDGGEQIG